MASTTPSPCLGLDQFGIDHCRPHWVDVIMPILVYLMVMVSCVVGIVLLSALFQCACEMIRQSIESYRMKNVVTGSVVKTDGLDTLHAHAQIIP